MIRRLPRSLVHGLLALSAAVWLFSGVASGLHHLLVRHVVCADHGELVELDDEHAAAAAVPSEGPELRAVDHHDHDHGCDELLVDRLALPTAHAKPAHFLVLSWRSAPMTGAEAPRGPPLAYAPKTSPPSLA